jgi:hypothetical protein
MCTGCGAIAAQHPYAGVARDQETGLMAAWPICARCWVDPSHRQYRLKMHFFTRQQAEQAVQDAEANILADPPPPE